MACKQEGKLLSSRRRTHETSEVQSTRVLLQVSSLCSTASHRILKEEMNEQNRSLQEQLMDKDQHITKLQDALQCEREKNSKLLSRCNQQAVELKRREQLVNRMREKLSQFTDRHRDRGVSMEIMNALPKPSAQRESAPRSARNDGRKEEALQLMLERREAELREAMKLRHSLTTLLHTLRTDMQQTLKEILDPEVEKTDTSRLVQSEQSLGDHVTGGVFLEWTHVQKKLRELQSQSPAAVGTDQEKLLAQLEEELEQSRELVRVQQQLLQDSVSAPLPDPLIDSYYLEEWERLQDKWTEFNRQCRSFQQERQAFTDAAIRLGRERCEFEQQKASLLKQQFLSTSPVIKTSRSNRRESTALSDIQVGTMAPDRLSLSPCVTPSPEGSEVAPWSGQNTVMTPNTPELYCVLQLPVYCRESASPPAETWVKETRRGDFSLDKQNVDNWTF
ncbi:afadin- and alpha-actinin-binding protein isoform X1 [Clarias gariepinus]|uniref:afadin- and alpha-actinin-binding protein isoform X1 n=1 Tax=Clarias gariepinus TaxID=13013 RepID=UPI00234D7745|nr:afadin- and alpha-actinin-binding protein isoform X1 [Clarias gariepinus]